MDVRLASLSGTEPIRHNFEFIFNGLIERFDSVGV
jgi:hypothetical protein